MRHLLIILSFLLLTFPTAVYSAQNRVALVIGNGAYRNAPLRNPVNDARLMRNLLRKAGFSVTIVENARKNELINAIRSFGRSLKNSDAALFYFSGHGNQYKSLNWLIPIGANVQRESDLEFEAVNAERVLAEMEGGSSRRVNIVIFDACRANRTFRSFRSYSRGFAFPKVQPEGSIVAFSTAPGTVAYDGEGRNSPYVAELSKHMLTPGLKIEDVFKRVRIGVKNRTSRKPSPQIPWENSAMTGDFYFVYAGGEPTPEPSSAKVSADIEMWELIKSSKDPTEFESFLRAFPNSQFVPIARLKLKRLKGSQESKQVSWIQDPSTSLYWEKISAGKKLTWDRAKAYCNNLNIGGAPWRLPNMAELVSLYESNIKEVLKINGDYWSSDTPRSEMGYGERTFNIAYSFDFSSDLDKRLYKQSGLNDYANAPIERNSYKVVICVN